MNQFIIVVFTIAIAVSHLILLNRIRDLSDLLNLQGSEFNKYFTLFGELAERIAKLEKAKEPPKEQPMLVELLDHIAVIRDDRDFNLFIGFKGKTRTQVIPVTDDFFLLDDNKLLEEIKELARQHKFIPLDHKVVEFLGSDFKYEREVISRRRFGEAIITTEYKPYGNELNPNSSE